MISDITYELSPIEKLDQFGVSALDNSELLAIMLGGHEESGRTMLHQYGRLAHIAAATTAELSELRGVGRVKAARITAAFELAVRLAIEQIPNTTLESPERIFEHFGPQLSHQPQERVLVATVDTRLRHMSTSLISMGTVNECTAHPREIMRPVITRAAYGFVMVHNHPSGDPSPSRADEAITRRIAEVSGTMQVRFVDHVIVGRPSPGKSPYFSFREAGVIA